MQKNPLTNEITFDNMPQAIAKVYEEVTTLRTLLTDLQQRFEPKQPTEYLTRSEVAKLLSCDLSTLHNWVKKGKLVTYGIGNRIYFRRSDIDLVLAPSTKTGGAKDE